MTELVHSWTERGVEVVDVDTSDRPAWIEARRRLVGASDTAGILGRSPWASPWTVWAEKVGLLPAHDDPSPSMRFGRDVEGIVALYFTEATGLWVAAPQLMVRRTGTVFAATLDGLVVEGPSLEAVSPLGVFESKWSAEDPWDELPDQYVDQLQWAMFVTGLDRAWLASIHAPRGRIQPLQVREVALDRDRLDDMVARVSTFWIDHVETGEPPPLDSSKATRAALDRAYPAGTARPDVVVDLDELRPVVDELAAVKADLRFLQADERRLEAVLRAELADATEGHVEGRLAVSWRPQHRQGYWVADSDYRVLRLHKRKTS